MSALLARIPKKYFTRSKPLIDAMLVSKDIVRWTEDLELVVKDEVLPNTNVAELIVHALQPIKMKEKAPNGFSKFIKVLAILGLESQYVENEYAQEILDGSESSSDDSDSSSDSSDDAEMEEEEEAGSTDTADSSDEEPDAKREEEEEEEEEEGEEETGSASDEERDAKREEGNTGSSSDDEKDVKMEDEESGSDDDENLYINSSGFYTVKKEQEKTREKLKKKTKQSVNETPVNLPTCYTRGTRRGFGGVSTK